jgi:hypothetical protein
MEVFSVAYVSGSIARQPMSSYISRSRVIKNSLVTYPSQKLVETVGTAVTQMESMLAEVAHFSSVEQHITAAIKNIIDFEWIRSSTFRDYVQETYFELELHLFIASQTFLSSQYSRTPLSENGQSSFCQLSSSNYISIEDYVGNSFLTHMVLVYV